MGQETETEQIVADQPQEEPQKIKVGEKEYNQEELARLVGLGELGSELEGRWNTKLDRLASEYTKTSQERADLKRKVEELEGVLTKEKADQGFELSPEEARKQALAQAKELGLLSIEDFEVEARRIVREEQAAKELREDAEAAIEEAQEKYGLKTDMDTILTHMSETGIRNPWKALKDKYEPQIDAWKEQQIGKVKSGGMQTIERSNAGAKEPEEKKLTDLDSLREALRSRLNRS